MNVPLCVPEIGEEEIEAVSRVLKSGWLAHGPENKKFEEGFAQLVGTKYAVSMNSCTSALHVAIEGQNITEEVILPSFTFAASANAIITGGAKPVFVDIDEKTCNIDPEKIKEKITSKTQAIMPVHYAGQVCDMKAIMDIAQDHNLKVIEDTAETIGGTFEGKVGGSFDVGCFSFYPTKNMTTGEGGMLTTDDEVLATRAKALRAHGIVSGAFEREKQERPWLRKAEYAGYNFRLGDMLAALGNVQLAKIPSMNEKRRSHSAFLNKELGALSEIEIPYEDPRCKHVYQMYTIKVKEGIDRNAFVAKLRAKGIGASVHFDPPVHKHPYYANMGWKPGELPVTEDVAERIVTLPMFPSMTQEQLNHIVASVKESL